MYREKDDLRIVGTVSLGLDAVSKRHQNYAKEETEKVQAHVRIR